MLDKKYQKLISAQKSQEINKINIPLPNKTDKGIKMDFRCEELGIHINIRYFNIKSKLINSIKRLDEN